MKCGTHKGQRMEKRSSFDERRSAQLGILPPASQEMQRYIQRGADELREKKRGQCESPFKSCANIKPNDLKLFQEGIKATCYFE